MHNFFLVTSVDMWKELPPDIISVLSISHSPDFPILMLVPRPISRDILCLHLTF